MNLLELVCLLSSGFVQFIVVALVIGCFLPEWLIPIYSYGLAIIIIGGLIWMFISLFK